MLLDMIQLYCDGVATEFDVLLEVKIAKTVWIKGQAITDELAALIKARDPDLREPLDERRMQRIQDGEHS